MPPSPPEKLIADALAAGLPFVVVGGHAINAYGYTRTTLDLDLLISEDCLHRWNGHLLACGYQNVLHGPAFAHFRGDELYPVDLLVVDRPTFDKIHSRHQRRLGGLPVPAPLHLVALKIHALRNAQRAALGKDLQDVVSLAKSCGLRWDDPEFQRVLERYADDARAESYAMPSPVQAEARDFQRDFLELNLPPVDQPLADYGMSEEELFRMSLWHSVELRRWLSPEDELLRRRCLQPERFVL